VLGAIKVRPGNGETVASSEQRPTLIAPAPVGVPELRLGRKKAFGEVEPKKCSKAKHRIKSREMALTWEPPYKGKLIGAKPPLRPSHVWSIRAKLQIDNRKRDLALFNLAIDSKLRGCDVVAIRVDDVAPSGYSIDRATVRQKKTGRPVRFELTEQTRLAIDDYLRLTGRKPGQFLFAGRGGGSRGLTTRQYARLVQEWVASIGLDPKMFGTHSLRRTKAVLIYRRTGNLRAVQLLLGHSDIASTVRYLGIEVDDAIEIAEKTDI